MNKKGAIMLAARAAEACPNELKRPRVVSLEKRYVVPEIIDEPDLEPAVLEGELRALERINRWSCSARIVWRPVRRLAFRMRSRPVRVLDVATGGGDVPIALLKKAGKMGLALEVDGCDVKQQAVEYAARRAEAAGVKARFYRLNALEEPLPPDYDVIMCSLFLHHLNDADASRLLERMVAAARHATFINDLERSRRGLLLAYVGSRVLTRSSETHRDAPQSVRAAFTVREMATLADRAGLRNFRVERRWPCRFLFEWER